ncbi:phospholipase A2 [Nonomuraea angiospora]|uniref:phospholipase A2 n=1 Tax=Nonomuraea angiospora TaxID=46172 RepID=UPI00340C66CD
MRRLTVVTAVTTVIFPLLAVAPGLSAVAAAAADSDQPVGPGQYFADAKTFEISEIDAASGAIGRKHGVAAVDGALAQPKAVPASRVDLSVFGPGWQAEFLGGMTGRKLETQSGAVLVTDLDSGQSVRYAFKSSATFPGGGGVERYQADDGSKLTQTTRWDSAAGAMRTTISETVATDFGTPEADDTGFTDDAGNPISAADVNQSYTWEQVGASQGDTWRVTGVGTTAFGNSTVTYDPQGRVSTVTEPAAGEDPQSALSFTYATSTTATGSTFGDYAGRLKQIKQTTGSGTPETVAAYGYDASGLLRSMSDPRESGNEPATYAYDGAGRLTAVDSHLNGEWTLAYSGESALPSATAADGTRPPDVSEPPAMDVTPPTGTPGGEVSGPTAYPSYCWAAVHWMYYSRSGCAAYAAHYGWQKPAWRQLPSRRWVVGIYFRKDICDSSPDAPSGFNFRAACMMHDYGYGLIGNTWKSSYYPYHLDRSRKNDVDVLFYTTLRDWTCNAYAWYKRGLCRSIAWTYRQGVRKGNPKNGANATRP